MPTTFCLCRNRIEYDRGDENYFAKCNVCGRAVPLNDELVEIEGDINGYKRGSAFYAIICLVGSYLGAELFRDERHFQGIVVIFLGLLIGYIGVAKYFLPKSFTIAYREIAAKLQVHQDKTPIFREQKQSLPAKTKNTSTRGPSTELSELRSELFVQRETSKKRLAEIEQKYSKQVVELQTLCDGLKKKCYSLMPVIKHENRAILYIVDGGNQVPMCPDCYAKGEFQFLPMVETYDSADGWNGLHYKCTHCNKRYPLCNIQNPRDTNTFQYQ